MPDTRPQFILVVEDSDEDYTALLRALRKLAINNPLHRCLDGGDCLDYLYRQGQYATAQHDLPGLILLDLNLPGTDGREVLAQIKGERALKSIPIVVVTTSINPQDVQICYVNGANSYVVKQSRFDKFQEAIQQMMIYWLETVTLPSIPTQ
jgi:CheY-like chemotaxis protein